MTGTPLEQAAAALQTATRAVDELRRDNLTVFIAGRRVDNALSVVSACMAQMTAEQSRITRGRLIDAAEVFESTVDWLEERHQDWANQSAARIRSIARGGS